MSEYDRGPRLGRRMPVQDPGPTHPVLSSQGYAEFSQYDREVVVVVAADHDQVDEVRHRAHERVDIVPFLGEVSREIVLQVTCDNEMVRCYGVHDFSEVLSDPGSLHPWQAKSLMLQGSLAPQMEIGYDDVHYNPSGPWSKIMGFNGWSPARAIGIVPVEADGSAYFEVPVSQPIYFQALDENYMEVRRMRSMVTLQPGERRGCIGCHETSGKSLQGALSGMGTAIRRPASKPEPPAWGNTIVPSFEQHIQPILDRHCVSCHGAEKPKGGQEMQKF